MLPLLIALAGGLCLDWIFGDPRNKLHPVAWLGRFIGYCVPGLKGKKEKVQGSIFALSLVIAAGLVAHFLLFASMYLAGVVALAIVSAIMLKITIAVRSMERHVNAIILCLQTGDLVGARKKLSMIVRRSTEDLDEQHILSAVIECISESTVDGITGPIFYYSIFGPAGAFAYRTINTLDSMVGYRDDYFIDIGWMSARLDSAANYLPARLTALLMIVAARISGWDWKNSLHILQRDHAKTFSPNAGYPMATMAGALDVRLEKIGHYAIGDERMPTSIEKCDSAIGLMKITTLFFCLFVSAPLISILYFAGWWRLVLGIP